MVVPGAARRYHWLNRPRFVVAGTESSSSALAAVPHGHSRDDVLPDGIARERTAPSRFSESEYSQWSAYDLSRRDERHDRLHAAVNEARSSEPALAAELEALFAQLRAATSAPAGADPASELVGEMERVAATTLHSALLELLHAHGVNEEDCHNWSTTTGTAVSRVPASMPDPSGGNATVWGVLEIAPPSLKWIPHREPDMSGSEHDADQHLDLREGRLARQRGQRQEGLLGRHRGVGRHRACLLIS